MSATYNTDDDAADTYVMVNGMPGPMATAAAEACLRKGLKLASSAMTGPDIEARTIVVYDPISEKSSEVKLMSTTVAHRACRVWLARRASARASAVRPDDVPPHRAAADAAVHLQPSVQPVPACAACVQRKDASSVRPITAMLRDMRMWTLCEEPIARRVYNGYT